jgi:hypothetical protein
MTIALLAAFVAVNIAYLVLLDRKDTRCRLERDSDRDERQVLLQRIQAPEAATYEHAAQRLPADPSPYPASDEQLAEEEERNRVLAFIERHENGGAE